MNPPHPDAPFFRAGPAQPASPVVLSVPHAGRNYSESLLRAARVPRRTLELLEDRLVDRLVWRAVEEGATAFVAQVPRAEIDLNRDEREIDPALIAPPPPSASVLQSARTRGGLGLVPSRIAGTGAIWLHRISRDELRRRVETVHRPYHEALAEALRAARDRFGAAILLDCHSMPPREPVGGVRQASIVFGDRHGATIAPAWLHAAVRAARGLGWSTAQNSPYAGGHIVTRHGSPRSDIHAVQLEIDRSAYLDEDLREPGPGFDRTATLIAAVAAALAEQVMQAPLEALAAE
ncbi:MAG TPA: N-formylglutamate amidohydrolase [Allosphingosinicella sp.]|jgi:N-formylglutamate amidohydrolase